MKKCGCVSLWYALTLLLCVPSAAQDVPTRASKVAGLFIPPPAGDIPQWAQLLYSDNPNAWQVKAAYEEYYNQHPFEKTIHTQNYKRWVSRIQHLVDAHGNVRTKSAEEKTALEHELNEVRGGGSLWNYAGPEIHYADDGQQVPLSEHANVYCIDRAMSNPALLYCGTESGGLYKSIDQGMSWEFVTKDLLVGAVSAVCIHPSNNDVVIFSAENDLYRTTDGGQSWTIIGQPDFVSLDISAWEIAFNPANNNIVYAATNQGFFRSTNGGDYWDEVLPYESQAVQFKPDDPSVVYTLQHLPFTDEFKFYKSTDSGQSFTMYDVGWFKELEGYTNIDVFGGRLAVTQADPNRIYALLVGYGQYNANSYTNGWIGTWVSYDAGHTWSFPHGIIGTPYTANHQNLMNFSADDGDYTQILYNTTMAASQIDADKVLIGGLNLWRSDDACASYTGVGGYIGGLPYFHVDQQELKVFKTGPTSEEVWCTNDGGICYSTDFMQSIENRNRGIMAVNLWGYDQGWNEDMMVGGRYHNGNMGYFETFEDGDFLALGGGEAPTGYVNYSDQNKAYFSDIGGRVLPEDISETSAYFSMSLSPNESYWANNSSRILFDNRYYNVAWLGRQHKLYKSINGGSSFSEAYSFGTNPNHPVLWIEQSYADPNYMYVHQRAGNTSKIWQTTDGGQTWNTLNLPYTLSNLYFDLSATNPEELWVGYMYGGNGNKIFHTTNSGIQWANLTTPALNGKEIWGVAHQYGTNGGVYLAMLNGTVYYRNNTMSDWDLYSSGLPASTQPIRIVPMYKKGLIRLATWNLGVWEAPLYEPSALLADFAAEYGSFFCPGDPVHFVDHSVCSADASYAWSFPGATPDASTEKFPTVTYAAPGTYNVTLTVNDNGLSQSVTKTSYISSQGTGNYPLQEDFETGSMPEAWKWAHSTGGSGNWTISSEASGFGNGQFAMFFDNYWYDAQGNRDEIWLGKSQHSGWVSLQFDVAYAPYGWPYSDTLAVLYSVDCAENWQTVFVKGGVELSTAPANSNPFVPNAGQWRTEVVQFNPQTSDIDEIIFAFQNRGHWGNYLFVDNININTSVSIPENFNADFMVFPNPATSQVMVRLPAGDSGMITLTLTNALGEEVWQEKFYGQGNSAMKEIQIGHLASGVYQIRLKGNHGDMSKRLIKR